MEPPRHKQLISVVMPVHNALPHLDEAVQSILGQSRRDFEFVIFDDASTDGSAERLEHWARLDDRIRLFRSEENLGPAASSNRVVLHARAPLIARMDADDISGAERLERQARLLEERPDVGLVGSLCEVIDSSGRILRGPEYWRLTRKCWSAPFPHGSIMFRRKLFDEIGGYRDECEYWEDLDFVLRMAERSKILVLPRPLYRYRRSDTSTRIASNQARVEKAIDLWYRSMSRVQQNRGYDDLLRDGAAEAGRLHPRVFVALGSLVLWTDGRPRLVRRLLRRGKLGFDISTIGALAWTLWAHASPSTLRVVVNLRSRVLNALTKRKASRLQAVEWRKPGRADDGRAGESIGGEDSAAAGAADLTASRS